MTLTVFVCLLPVQARKYLSVGTENICKPRVTRRQAESFTNIRKIIITA